MEKLINMLEQATRIAVVGHTHPDGDALGCTAAMALTLAGMGKEAACIFSDTPADNLLFLLAPGIPYFFHDADAHAAEEFIGSADLVILMDCNGFPRTEALEPFLSGSAAKKILIDHHLNPDRDSFDEVVSTPDISSASELTYWTLKELGITKEAGYYLMAGMTTDTNNFANSVFPSTFRMASELIEMGVDRDEILSKIYSSYRENRVRLMGYMQYKGMTILPCGAAFMILTKEIIDSFDLREGETEGLVNVPLSIADVRMSVLLKEDGDHFRVSVRSKKETSAQKIAMTHFHGGGHENAAGGKLFPGQDFPAREDAAQWLTGILTSFLS